MYIRFYTQSYTICQRFNIICKNSCGTKVVDLICSKIVFCNFKNGLSIINYLNICIIDSLSFSGIALVIFFNAFVNIYFTLFVERYSFSAISFIES